MRLLFTPLPSLGCVKRAMEFRKVYQKRLRKKRNFYLRTKALLLTGSQRLGEKSRRLLFILKRYVEDREGIFKEIQKDRPELDKATLKKAFLAIVNGGRGLEEKNPPKIIKEWKVM